MTDTARDLERKSSAVTLSDMEIFVFPELMYALVLANIMSPRIWRWRDDPWFAGLDRMKPYRRISRLKQFIMDRYTFNLDLETWGLTTREAELARFRDFISEDTIRQSNALFGYEGDKYYFDIDIRTHFGLDKVAENVIPYWKTETVEAMDAFRHKPGYESGAGECVSLATLYAAALFIVARIPLRDLYLMATPLHSQNFIDLDDGILTNNRRLVTKAMWCNGTALSAQARRALENERVTIVAHETGCVHTLYGEASIQRDRYDYFVERLRAYLTTPFSPEMLGNFVRSEHQMQKCFQMRWPLHGVDHYIALERIFAYEHGSPYRITDRTRGKLMDEIDREEFLPNPLPSRIVLNELESFAGENDIDINNPADVARLKERFASTCLNAEIAIECLTRFCHVDPDMPDPDAKTFVPQNQPLGIEADMTREEVIERVESIRDVNPMADMAFYAYRDLGRTEAAPFLLAAVRRNPVCVEATRDQDDDAVLAAVRAMPDESVYDETGRLAQPDEVWNYGRGDGAEKAVLLAALLRRRDQDGDIVVSVGPREAACRAGGRTHAFPSSKGLAPAEWSVPSLS